jgi:hypothetical protein
MFHLSHHDFQTVSENWYYFNSVVSTFWERYLSDETVTSGSHYINFSAFEATQAGN